MVCLGGAVLRFAAPEGTLGVLARAEVRSVRGVVCLGGAVLRSPELLGPALPPWVCVPGGVCVCRGPPRSPFRYIQLCATPSDNGFRPQRGRTG